VKSGIQDLDQDSMQFQAVVTVEPGTLNLEPISLGDIKILKFNRSINFGFKKATKKLQKMTHFRSLFIFKFDVILFAAYRHF
jgi:hypothetical protein